jgi:hypothetical protein
VHGVGRLARNLWRERDGTNCPCVSEGPSQLQHKGSCGVLNPYMKKEEKGKKEEVRGRSERA